MGGWEAGMGRCPQRPEEVVTVPGAGVTGGCEPLDVGAWAGTWSSVRVAGAPNPEPPLQAAVFLTYKQKVAQDVLFGVWVLSPVTGL